MRLFLAVTPPENLRRELGVLLPQWTEELGGRWPSPENLHLTLAFLGELEEGRREAIEAAADAAAHRPAFAVEWGGLGVFPSWRAARVAYLGVQEGEERLAALARELIAALPADLRPRRRPFRAHLTVARFRRPPRQEDLRRLAAELAPLSWSSRIEAIEFFESRLHPDGARYRLLSRHPLEG